ncbi:unnamed protein product [Spirodela intermedia]|uniref:Uncharacterized protein n=1 Tax=Spirodela intermedia TaxID=51605 RepID=A0A7I8JS18_SPIIN|nr:unnamed protein product [Spirodela intermedia]CAA6673007.1 unnamed protein product [Spirodela intermedia]
MVGPPPPLLSEMESGAPPRPSSTPPIRCRFQNLKKTPAPPPGFVSGGDLPCPPPDVAGAGASYSIPPPEPSTARETRNAGGRRRGSSGEAESSSGGSPPSSPDVLVALTGLVIKALGFQISLLVTSVAFPLRLLCFSIFLVADPCGTLNRGADALRRFYAALQERIGSLFFENLSGNRGMGKIALRVSVGCFWSLYVFFTLVACLITALLIGRLITAAMVEEPLRFTEDLSFDYTRNSPAVEVLLGRRLVPPGRRLKSTVSLTLPESDYNRNLGIFQVESAGEGGVPHGGGEAGRRLRRHCMLRFKSPPIRFLESFFRSGLLLAGYSSESQTLSLKMRSFTEGAPPTAAARIVLEPRAEHRQAGPGAGLPEIYAASLTLESELPLVRKLLWDWRRTLLMCMTIAAFNSELMMLLVCCAPLILPGSTRRRVPSSART